MEIRKVEADKKQHLDLLLLADDGVEAECVVTDEGDGILELKNIAVVQGKGYGKAMVDFLTRTYTGQYAVLQVGIGDSPSTIPFYEFCGFAGITWSRTSSSTTMTTQFMSAGCSWWIWCICKESCKNAECPMSGRSTSFLWG